jgi:hypothetical protein
MVAGLVALTACSHDSGLPPDAMFNVMDPQTATDGVLVVGMKLVRPPTAKTLLFGPHKVPAWFLMTFRGVDAANHFTRVQRSVQVCDEITPTSAPFARCDPTQMVYRVIRMPAGRYVLSDFALHEDRLTVDTNFVRAPEQIPFAGRHGPGYGAPPTLVAFDVTPREVTYIGEFNMTRGDLAAQAALDAHPLVAAPVVFRPIVTIPVNAYPTRG